MQKYLAQHQQSSLNIEILSKYKNNIFIESGSNTGEAIKIALSLNFKKIISCEPEKTFYNLCKTKFIKNNVELYNLKSEDAFPLFIKDIEEEATFWLDGHGNYDCPIIKELTLISKSPYKNHTILIDDCRMFGHDLWNQIKKEDVIKTIKQINSKYNIFYENTINGENDIMVAKI